MSTPDPRLSRRDAERLLDAPAEHDSVLGLALTAASAPAHAEELRREDAAVAAFHAARVSPVPATRTGYVSPSRLGSRAAARAVVATGAVVALMSGGFALASSTDLPGVPGLPDLPALPGQAADQATESVAEAPRGAAGSASSATSGSGGTSPSGSATSPGSSGATDPSGSTTPSESPDDTSVPSPALEGLCRAFQATDRADTGGSLDSAAFQALAAEAGGADRIATYCVDLIGPPKQTGKPTDQPTPTTRPSPTKPTPTKPTPSPGKPTDQPTDQPAPSPGKPTDKPTPSSDKPTDQPSPSPGKPSDLPTPDGAGGPDKPDNPGKGGEHQSSG
jgi:hypothetical protein